MRRSLPFILILVAGAAAALIVAGAMTVSARAAGDPVGSPPIADTVYTNGVVYTADAAHTTAQAVAVKNGVIVYVGDDAGAAVYAGAGTTTVDLGWQAHAAGLHRQPHARQHGPCPRPVRGVPLRPAPTMQAYQKADPRLRRQSTRTWRSSRAAGGRTPWSSGRRPDEASSWTRPSRNRPAVISTRRTATRRGATPRLSRSPASPPRRRPRRPASSSVCRLEGSPRARSREAAADLVTSRSPKYTVDQMKAGIQHFQQDEAARLSGHDGPSPTRGPWSLARRTPAPLTSSWPTPASSRSASAGSSTSTRPRVRPPTRSPRP